MSMAADFSLTFLGTGTSVGIPVIASGGAGNLEHLRAALQEGGADAALAASIFHFCEYSVAEAKEYLAKHGVPVRVLAQA